MLLRMLLIGFMIGCIFSSVMADPILLAPRGTTLTTGQVRAEAAFSPGNDEGKYFWLGTGFAQFEANIIRFDPAVGDAENMINVQWNFIPETLLTPALSFGATDIADETSDGIGVYVAATRTFPTGRLIGLLREVSVSAGVGIGGIDGPFGGVEIKLPYGLFAQGEYDSNDFNAAVGWQPVSLFRVKAYWLRDEVYYGAELVPVRF